jgi:YVTN family beta-propeller protein
MRYAVLLSAVVIGATCVSVGGQTPDAAEFPRFVGRAVCVECHAPDHRAKPCSLRSVPEHGRAYAALRKQEALEIAALSGVAWAPTESRICMACHTAAGDVGRRWTADTFRVQDGVQCESCHEAGSLHAAWRRTAGSEEGRPRFDVAPAREPETCRPCHVPKQSHEEVLVKGFRRHPVDREYKTPVNLAIAPDGDHLYVVCEQSNSVIVLDTQTGCVAHEIEVGLRPQSAAMSPDGTTLYVTNRMSDTLSVVEVSAGRVTREVAAGNEPHGVVTNPDGTRLYVAATGQNVISVFDAGTLTELKRLTAGVGPWSAALSPDGQTIYVTNVRPNPARFRDPPQSEVSVLDARREVVVSRAFADGANMLQGIAFVPGRGSALFTLMRTKSLIPTTRLTQGWTITNGLGVVWPDGRVDQVLLDEPAGYFPDPWDVAVSPDGRYALVTSGGADETAVIDVPRLLDVIESADDQARRTVLPNHLGTSTQYVLKRIQVGRNPRGVVFSPDGRRAYVANALDDSVSVIDVTRLAVERVIGLGGPSQISQLRHGARVFHSADIAFGRQFSCRSCHPDGHINGLPLDIEADGIGVHPVDNRTLRGILDTAPYKWEGTNPSLHRQCGARLAVFFTRLAPYAPDDLDALVRYMCTIEQPRNPNRSPGGLTLAQRRGKAVFERKYANDGTPLKLQQQCTPCHSGAYQTARFGSPLRNTMWFDEPLEEAVDDLFDAKSFGELGVYYYVEVNAPPNFFDVPHLTNIYNSAPYLHNGAAPTLEEIWTRFSVVDDHGKTIDLTRQQFNDLIAYLKAL